jgi:hypothetical protein
MLSSVNGGTRQIIDCLNKQPPKSSMITATVRKRLWLMMAIALFIALLIVGKEQAVVAKAPPPKIEASFSRFYSLVNLGSVRQLPPAYGGITFKPGDPNTLVIGGLADTPESGVYSVRVRRNKNNYITGFVGAASFMAKTPGIGKGGIDAGLTYSPKGDVLFYTTYDDNSIGQIKSGSKIPNKQTDLNSLAIAPSVGALAFVPSGFSGAGRLKITSYTDNLFYDTTITPDRWGTYDIAAPLRSTQLSGGTDSFVYIKAGNPGFSQDSLLMTEYDTNKVSAYVLDANGDPIANTRQDFIKGIAYHSPAALTGTIGTTIDPLTGDVIFSSFFEDDAAKSKILAVRGFNQPPASFRPRIRERR